MMEIAMRGSFLWTATGILIASTTPSPSAEPIGVLLAAGDIASCYSKRTKFKETAALIGQQVAEAKAKGLPIRVLVLGDLAYSDPENKKKEKSRRTYYAKCFEAFEASWGKYKDVLLPVPGNHEYEDDPNKNASMYRAYFADSLKALNAKDGAYYAYSFPEKSPQAWLLIGLNRYEQWGEKGKKGKQETWLDGELASSTAPCVLAFAHPFINSSGRHGIKMKMIDPNMLTMRDILYHRAATVFVGAHDHSFEQFAPQDASGKRAEDGIRTFVVGTGGVSPYPEESTVLHPLRERFNKKSRGLLRIELFADHYTWSFLSIPGASAIDLPVTESPCNKRRKPGN
jgi:hypothetical protein